MNRIIEIILPSRQGPRHPRDLKKDNFWPLAIITITAITTTGLITLVALLRDPNAAAVATAIAAISALSGAAYGRLRR